MKLGVLVAANSGSLCISLGLCNSFSFGVVSILLLRFPHPFKCTVDMKLQTLVTPYSNALCNRNKCHSISLFVCFKMHYFTQHFFSNPQKKTLDYSLWFIQNFDETMTAPKL